MSDEALAALSLDEEVTCPICEAKLLMSALNRHIDMGCPPPPSSKPGATAPATASKPAPAAAPAAATTAAPSTKGKKKGRAIDISDAFGGGATSARSPKGPPAKQSPIPPMADVTPAEAFPSLSSQATKAPQPQPPKPQPPKPQPPLPTPQTAEELRIDPADGNAYTRADFIAEYGGTREWELAKPAAATAPPAVPQAAEELRIDPADGNAYTRADFIAEYGSTREWELAKPAAATAPPAVPAAPKPGVWGGGAPSLAAISAAGTKTGSAPATVAAGPARPPALTASEAAAALDAARRRFSQLTLEELYQERLFHAPGPRPPRARSFELQETVNGKRLNSLSGLALHELILSPAEQELALLYCGRVKDLGDEGALMGRTYTAPRKWRRGNGRVTVQMGCCYNYATDKDGHPPGILPREPVCGLPPFLEDLLDRMVGRGIFNARTRPDSCIINFYSVGDCIPPHIDHLDFARPFVTLSLLSEQSILFGANIEIVSEGEFTAPFSCPLPVGSVLVLDGNGANVAKHCVPSVSSDRVSITFRKIGSRIKMTPFRGPHGST